MGFFLSSKFKKEIPENLKAKVAPEIKTYNSESVVNDPRVIAKDYKNVELYSNEWMAIWRRNPDLQKEMLEYRDKQPFRVSISHHLEVNIRPEDFPHCKNKHEIMDAIGKLDPHVFITAQINTQVIEIKWIPSEKNLKQNS